VWTHARPAARAVATSGRYSKLDSTDFYCNTVDIEAQFCQRQCLCSFGWTVATTPQPYCGDHRQRRHNPRFIAGAHANAGQLLDSIRCGAATVRTSRSTGRRWRVPNCRHLRAPERPAEGWQAFGRCAVVVCRHTQEAALGGTKTVP
jgi:hypothetical protein